MHDLLDQLPRHDDSLQQRDYRRYLAQRMGPMIHALMLVATLVYLVAVLASSVLQRPLLSVWLRALPLLPLALVTLSTRQARRPHLLSALTLLFVVLLEVSINLNTFGNPHRQTMCCRACCCPWSRR